MKSSKNITQRKVENCFLGIFLVLWFGMTAVYSQQKALSLEKAYHLAEANYPLIKDAPLLENITEMNLAILKRKRLPTIDLIGVGQVQSENVSIGGADPNSTLNIDVPLESYRTYLDLNFNLFDGGLTKVDKKIEESQLMVNKQSLEVSLRNLKDQVNNLFLNILLLKQQKDLLQISKNDITTNIEILQAGFANGAVLESELSKLKVRKIELESEEIGIQGDINAFLDVLSKFLGKTLTNGTDLILPESLFRLQNNNDISRPEQQLFNYQTELLETQKGRINAGRLPKLSLYAQGGIGYPNPLNFADISTTTYGLGGLKLNWNLFDWGIAKKEKTKIDVQKRQIKVDREVFEFDIQKRKNEYLEKVGALEAQIKKDEEIVTLQSEILKQSSVQLKEGVINSNDYVLQVNAELSARQQLELHAIQKQKLQIEYLTLIGKL